MISMRDVRIKSIIQKQSVDFKDEGKHIIDKIKNNRNEKLKKFRKG